MNIKEFLEKENAKFTYRDRWLVYDNEKSKYIVKTYAKDMSFKMLIETSCIDIAFDKLMED